MVAAARRVMLPGCVTHVQRMQTEASSVELPRELATNKTVFPNQ